MTTTPSSPCHARKAAMALAVRASAAELAPVAALAEAVGFTELRPPETGLVMLRGRIGGDGAPFNLGEATVTRAAVALPTGEIGHGHVLGRDGARARLAAFADALWQRPDQRGAVEALLAPVGARLAAERALERSRTAATRVDFFTLVRGED